MQTSVGFGDVGIGGKICVQLWLITQGETKVGEQWYIVAIFAGKKSQNISVTKTGFQRKRYTIIVNHISVAVRRKRKWKKRLIKL